MQQIALHSRAAVASAATVYCTGTAITFGMPDGQLLGHRTGLQFSPVSGLSHAL